MYSAEVQRYSGAEERFPAISGVSGRLVRRVEDLERGLDGEGEEGKKEEGGGERDHVL